MYSHLSGIYKHLSGMYRHLSRMYRLDIYQGYTDIYQGYTHRTPIRDVQTRHLSGMYRPDWILTIFCVNMSSFQTGYYSVTSPEAQKYGPIISVPVKCTHQKLCFIHHVPRQELVMVERFWQQKTFLI